MKLIRISDIQLEGSISKKASMYVVRTILNLDDGRYYHNWNNSEKPRGRFGQYCTPFRSAMSSLQALIRERDALRLFKKQTLAKEKQEIDKKVRIEKEEIDKKAKIERDEKKQALFNAYCGLVV